MVSHLRQYGVSYLVAVAATIFVAALRLAFDSALTHTATFIPFVLPVMVAGWYGGLASGLLATALGAVVSTYLFEGPRYSFIDSWNEGAGVVIFLAVGVSVSLLCEAMHRGRRRLESERLRLTDALAGE